MYSNAHRPHVMSTPRIARDTTGQSVDLDRLVSLARDGRMDEFAAIAFGLPHLIRIEAPAARATGARRDAYAAALSSGDHAEAAAEAAKLFPNMNRI